MKDLKLVASVLLIIGGLNWLLVGLFGFDVGVIFGGQEALISRIVYILVGLSAIYSVFTLFPCSKKEVKKEVKKEEIRVETPVETQI